MDKQRETAPTWHCFAVYDDEILHLITELLSNHKDCECYCKEIFDNDLNEGEIDYDYTR